MIYSIEFWKDIEEAGGKYQISTLGEVRYKKTLRVLKMVKDKDGYLTFSLSINRKIRHTRRVHIMVATTFIRPIKKGELACHWDSDISNNTMGNIYIGDLKSNTLDKYRNGTTKLSIEDTIFIRENAHLYKQWELSNKFGVTQGTISRIINRKRGVFI